MADRNNPAIPAGQRWIPDRYARNAAFVAELGAPLLDLLDPKPGERILDLGCGDGALTEKIVARGAAVLGVDSSADQVAAARARGLDARIADGHDLVFRAEFDGVLSNAALHWMKRPDAVIAGVWRALRPGGRFVGEMGGEGNVAAVRRALAAAMERRGLDPSAADPWYFPGPAEYRARLEAAGFVVRSIELIPRPTPIPGDIADWLQTFAESFLFAVPEGERPRFLAEVADALVPALRRPGEGWVVDYVRLRFAAMKPAQ
jgi:trans-aconitate methyltransferase